MGCRLVAFIKVFIYFPLYGNMMLYVLQYLTHLQSAYVTRLDKKDDHYSKQD